MTNISETMLDWGAEEALVPPPGIWGFRKRTEREKDNLLLIAPLHHDQTKHPTENFISQNLFKIH